jgi:hypothetical protein
LAIPVLLMWALKDDALRSLELWPPSRSESIRMFVADQNRTAALAGI